MKIKKIKKHLFILRFINVIKKLPETTKRHPFYLALTILSTSIIELIGIAILIPLILLLLEDNYIQKHALILKAYEYFNFKSEQIFTITILAIVFFATLFKNIISIYLNSKQNKLALYIQAEISNNILKNYLKKNILAIKVKNSNRVIWEVNILPVHFIRFFLLPLTVLINELIITSLITISLLIYNPKTILLLIAVILPLTVIFYKLAKNKVQHYQKQQAILAPVISALAQQSIFGHNDITITNTVDYYLKKYDKNLSKSIEYNEKIFTLMQVPSKITEVAIISSMILLVTIAITTNIEKESILMFLGVFALAAFKLAPSFNKITSSIMSIKSYQYTLNFLSQALNDVVLNRNEQSIEEKEFKFDEEIKVTDLSFKYKKGTNVLNNISFSIKKGETIGVIGKSGSGKSTLMNILLGLFDSYEGKIIIDNEKLSKETLNSWHSKIGYVQQNIFLLDATIKENIAFGVDEQDIDYLKIQQVIESSNLTELIETLPNGIETKVGELGSLISGGQKQRIGIARSLYSDAEVLFFDEATSALDNDTETQITNTLNQLSKSNSKLTIIIIAHRYSTLINCDRIIELKNGRIESIKKYEDLTT